MRSQSCAGLLDPVCGRRSLRDRLLRSWSNEEPRGERLGLWCLVIIALAAALGVEASGSWSPTALGLRVERCAQQLGCLDVTVVLSLFVR